MFSIVAISPPPYVLTLTTSVLAGFCLSAFSGCWRALHLPNCKWPPVSAGKWVPSAASLNQGLEGVSEWMPQLPVSQQSHTETCVLHCVPERLGGSGQWSYWLDTTGFMSSLLFPISTVLPLLVFLSSSAWSADTQIFAQSPLLGQPKSTRANLMYVWTLLINSNTQLQDHTHFSKLFCISLIT